MSYYDDTYDDGSADVYATATSGNTSFAGGLPKNWAIIAIIIAAVIALIAWRKGRL